MEKVITYTRMTKPLYYKQTVYGRYAADESEIEEFLRNSTSPYDTDTKVYVKGHHLSPDDDTVYCLNEDNWRYGGDVFAVLTDFIVVSVDGKEVKRFQWDRLTEEDLSEWEDLFPYSLTQWNNREICQSFLEDGEVSVIVED